MRAAWSARVKRGTVRGAFSAVLLAAGLSAAPVASLGVVVPAPASAPLPAPALPLQAADAAPNAVTPLASAPLAAAPFAGTPPAPVASWPASPWADLPPVSIDAAGTGLRMPVDLGAIFSMTLADAQFAAVLGLGIGLVVVAAIVRRHTRRRLGWGVLPSRRWRRRNSGDA